jgi:hypothetical protein
VSLACEQQLLNVVLRDPGVQEMGEFRGEVELFIEA